MLQVVSYQKNFSLFLLKSGEVLKKIFLCFSSLHLGDPNGEYNSIEFQDIFQKGVYLITSVGNSGTMNPNFPVNRTELTDFFPIPSYFIISMYLKNTFPLTPPIPTSIPKIYQCSFSKRVKAMQHLSLKAINFCPVYILMGNLS